MKTFGTSRGSLVLFFLLILLSCEDTMLVKVETQSKAAIVSYLRLTQEKLPEEFRPKVDEVIKAVDFTEFEEIIIDRRLSIIVCKIRDLEGTDGQILFSSYSGEVLDSRVFHFEGFDGVSQQLVVKELLLNRPHSFSGRIDAFNLLGSLSYYEEFDLGKMVSKGVVKSAKKGKTNSKTKTCTDWYLVVTTYYSDGTTDTSQTYLGTTCNCSGNTYRSAKMQCDGGGGGGGDEGTDSDGSGGVGNHICGTYGFTYTGNAFTAQITQLGMSGVQNNGTSAFNFEFGVVCLTIPSANISVEEASQIFIASFNLASDHVYAMLNSGTLAPTSTAVGRALKSAISSNLGAMAPGSAFTVGPCLGNIATTAAQYEATNGCTPN